MARPRIVINVESKFWFLFITVTKRLQYFGSISESQSCNQSILGFREPENSYVAFLDGGILISCVVIPLFGCRWRDF